jgi:hypothetical protein
VPWRAGRDEGTRTPSHRRRAAAGTAGFVAAPTPLARIQASSLVAYLIEEDRVLVQQWLPAKLLTPVG